jgi:hypothetical protein
MLVVLGANPVYAAPADLKLVEALDKVPFRVHHGMAVDESAGRVHWHLRRRIRSRAGATCARQTARRRSSSR